MKLHEDQYNEVVDKIANEIKDSMEKTAAEAEQEQPLTDEQVAAIVAAKKEELAKKQAEKEKSEKEVSDVEKAAAVYEYSLNKIAASQELFNHGSLEQQACIETLAEAGLYDENGINKQAAESSEEAITLVNKIAEIYDDASEKIAAAQECYDEAIETLASAQEVLSEHGYTFE